MMTLQENLWRTTCLGNSGSITLKAKVLAFGNKNNNIINHASPKVLVCKLMVLERLISSSFCLFIIHVCKRIVEFCNLRQNLLTELGS